MTAFSKNSKGLSSDSLEAEADEAFHAGEYYASQNRSDVSSEKSASQGYTSVHRSWHEEKPLLVDLDRTLIKTDIFLETLLLFVKGKPMRVFTVAALLTKGVAYLKHKIAEQVDFSASALPINPEFLAYLKQEKQKRPIILMTAANEKLAHKINAEFNLFDEIHASTATLNLGPTAKLSRIEEMGLTEFDYAGDRRADLKIFDCADDAILVNPSPYLTVFENKAGASKVFDRTNHWDAYAWLLKTPGWASCFAVFLAPLFGGNFIASAWLSYVPLFFMFLFLNIAVQLFRSLFTAMEAREKGSDLESNPIYSGHLGIADSFVIISGCLVFALIVLWFGESWFLAGLFITQGILAVYRLDVLLPQFKWKEKASLHTPWIIKAIAGFTF